MMYKVSEATAAYRRFYLYLVQTDGITSATGEAAGVPQISKNGAGFVNTTATLVAQGNGSYYVELTAAELNTLGWLTVRYKSASTSEFSLSAQVTGLDPFISIDAQVWGAIRSAHLVTGSFGEANQITRAGALQAASTTGGTLDAGASATDDIYNGCLIVFNPGTASAQSEIIQDYTGATKAFVLGSTLPTAPGATSPFVLYPGARGATRAEIATEVWGTSVRELTDGAEDQIAVKIWGTVRSGNEVAGTFGEGMNVSSTSVTSIAAGVWNALTAGITTVNSIGKQLVDNVNATISSRSTLTAALVWDYLTASAATVGSIGKRIADNLDALVSSRSTLTAALVWDEARAGHVAAGSFGQGVASVQGNVTGSVASVTAEVGLLAADEDAIAGKVWDRARASHVIAGSFGQGAASVQGNVTGSVASVTADVTILAADEDSIAGKVWDRARASHVTVGTFGQGIASVQGNITGSVASVTASVAATVADKTGYSLTSAEEDTIVSKTWDKSRASHVTVGTFGQGVASVQGSVTGSVASVTGSVASVTGSVASVTGAVGSVTGSVGSVTASVTAGVVSDKTGYALSAAADTSIATAVWASTVRSLTTFGALVGNIWNEVLTSYVTASTAGKKLNDLTSGGGPTAIQIADALLVRDCEGGVDAIGNNMSVGKALMAGSGVHFTSSADLYTWKFPDGSVAANSQAVRDSNGNILSMTKQP